MTTLLAPPAAPRSLGDLLESLGGISPARVLLNPPPGRATVQDVVRVHDRDRRLCELVDGTLVQKAVGYIESMLAGVIIMHLRLFVVPRNLGLVTGESGMIELFAGVVRIPDVAYVSWARIPGGRVPNEPVPHLAPDLAVEVLSVSNTPGEMARKRREYFEAKVRMVWEVDPRPRTVAVYVRDGAPLMVLTEDQTLDGRDVLPGFSLPLRELFAELDRQAAPGSN
jgi:Uma2 family endonuclease